MSSLRARRMSLVGVVLVLFAVLVLGDPEAWQVPIDRADNGPIAAIDDLLLTSESLALSALESLPVKGRAPRTNYKREQFGSGWIRQQGCDMRNIILGRDLTEVEVNESCQVVGGLLSDPYTGKLIKFERGSDSSRLVQIDHVVALSNAWQTGAQQLNEERRVELSNDPLNLLAVDGAANQAKGDGDAATWLPPNKAFRCQYVARQIAVKQKYDLWVVLAEKDAMERILSQCPAQQLPEEFEPQNPHRG